MLDARCVELSKVRLDRAEEDLATAVENLNNGRYGAANNRAYYAIFHAIRSVLALDAVDFQSHAQVIGYFNKNYCNTNIIDRYFNGIAQDAAKSRNKSDYEDAYNPTNEEAERNINGAEEFLTSIKHYISERIEASTTSKKSP
jgi:uncharacterized protein (UPF0332 family)